MLVMHNASRFSKMYPFFGFGLEIYQIRRVVGHILDNDSNVESSDHFSLFVGLAQDHEPVYRIF